MMQETLPGTADVDIKWWPVSIAARALRVSPSRVYQLIREGALSARKVDRTVLVSNASVAARIEVLRKEDGRRAR